MTKAAFFINPLSYSVKKHGSVLSKSAHNENVTSHVLDTFDTLPNLVSVAANDRVQTVCIEGGDGTIHGVLSEFINQAPKFEKFPHFILLPGGMTNLVAKHVGIKKPTPEKIAALLGSLNHRTKTQLPLLKIQTEHGIHNGFLFSTGALPKGTHFCFDKVYTDGITGAAAVRTTLLRVLFGRGDDRNIILAPTSFSMNFGNTNIKGNHIVSIATTLPGLMIGLNPFWGEGNGAIRMTHVSAGAKHLISNMARMLKPKQSEKSIKNLTDNGFNSWTLDTAEMQYHGPMVLDGEFLPETNQPMTLSVSPPISFVK